MLTRFNNGTPRQDWVTPDVARQIFARVGLMLLGLDAVAFVVLILVVRYDGPGNIPAVLVGGAVGEYGFLVARSRLRSQVLAGAAEPDWISAGGPQLRERLLRAYSPIPTIALTSPYFFAFAAYGLSALPWPPGHDWQNMLVAAFFSAISAAGLANGAQWLYFSWLVDRTAQRT